MNRNRTRPDATGGAVKSRYISSHAAAKGSFLYAALTALVPLTIALILFFVGCSYEYVNITDRNGSAYQGYTTVATIDEVSADDPAEGETIVWCSFTASEVVTESADLYGLRIAASADGFETPFYENLTFTGNVMDASAAGLYEGTWYYRVSAHETKGDWGGWSDAVSFTASSGIDSAGISPADGGSTLVTTPLLEWADVDGAASYEVEFADSEAGLDGSDIRTAAGSQYQILDSDGFAYEETLCWRVRQVNEDGISGVWSDTFSVTIHEPLLDLVFVPSGTFSMGSEDGDSDEEPIHTVTVSDFYIGTYEVTQGLYQEVMGSNPASGYGVGESYPVYYVTWYDAVHFCNALSDSEGLARCYMVDGTSVTCDFTRNGYRLPTEAEWEFAARGGTDSNGYTYSGSETIDDVAWYSNNSGSSTHEAGTKAANELGIYDMSGNVWEWCWDWYNSGYYSDSVGATDPEGPDSGSDRVLRGGGWYYYADYCRVAFRSFGSPGYSSYGIGFRVVRRP